MARRSDAEARLVNAEVLGLLERVAEIEPTARRAWSYQARILNENGETVHVYPMPLAQNAAQAREFALGFSSTTHLGHAEIEVQRVEYLTVGLSLERLPRGVAL